MDRRRFYKERQKFIIRTYCQPVARDFVKWCHIAGLIPGKSIVDFKENPWGLSRAIWTSDRWDWVDPLKDIEALVAQKDAGWLTDEMYCELGNIDRENLYSTRKEEKELKKEMDIETAAVVPVKPKNPISTEELNNAKE
jgi:capsid protein